MGTVEKLTLENMGIAFGILFLGGTEPEIHLGDHISSPQLQRTFFNKNTISPLALITVCCLRLRKFAFVPWTNEN